MNRRNSTLLLIDDNPCHAEAFERALIGLPEGPSEFEWVRNLSCGLERLAHKKVWAVFLNLFLPDSQGINTLDRLRLIASTTPIIVLGGLNDEDICKTAMLHGAHDYLLEGHLDSYLFARAVRNIIEREIAREELFIEKEWSRVTLNSIGDAVLSTDLSGNVTYLNLAAEQMTGWSREEALEALPEEAMSIVSAVHAMLEGMRTGGSAASDPVRTALPHSKIKITNAGIVEPNRRFSPPRIWPRV